MVFDLEVAGEQGIWKEFLFKQPWKTFAEHQRIHNWAEISCVLYCTTWVRHFCASWCRCCVDNLSWTAPPCWTWFNFGIGNIKHLFSYSLWHIFGVGSNTACQTRIKRDHYQVTHLKLEKKLLELRNWHGAGRICNFYPYINKDIERFLFFLTTSDNWNQKSNLS